MPARLVPGPRTWGPSFLVLALLIPLVPVAAQSKADRARALNDEGVRLYEAGDYEKARRRFEEALGLDRKAEQIRTNLGRTHAAIALRLMGSAQGSGQGRLYRRALESLETSLLYWKGDDDTHQALALCHLHLGQLDSAERALVVATRHNPDSYRAWRLLGVVRERRHEIDGALEAWRKAIALQPNDRALKERVRRLEFDKKALTEFRVVSSPRFRLYVPPALSSDRARDIQKALEGVSAELEKRWAVPPPKGAIVICYPPGEFSLRTGLHEEVGGAYDGRIRIPFPDELEKGGLELSQVVRHEATHLMLHALPVRPPRWIDEGIAQVLDGSPRKEWEETFKALFEARPEVGIEERMAQFDEDDPRTWAPLYLHAFFFFRHLGEKYQEFRLDMLVREVARGRSWDEAFRSVYGGSAADLDRRWRRGLEEHGLDGK